MADGSGAAPGRQGILVVGLGNPGSKYESTYHNLGFLAVDRLAKEAGIEMRQSYAKALVGSGEIGGVKVWLAKPQTYMNLSGIAVKALLEKQNLTPADLVVVYDELALPWTAVRIRMKGSAGGHHGVESVISSLGSSSFARVRLGIHPGHEIRDGASFVLSPIKRGQAKELEEILDHTARAVTSIITEGVEKSMTKFNRRAQGSTEAE